MCFFTFAEKPSNHKTNSMEFINKNLSNILFFLFVIFLFTPFGLPVRTFFIKQVAFVTTRLIPVESDMDERVALSAYNWELKGLNGEKINLADYKDKVVVINIWATWCPPCIAEMPSFQKLYDEFEGNKEVVFLFVASDDVLKVKKFLAKKGYNLPVYFSVGNAPGELSSGSLPTTYILNKQGDIVVNKIGAADWSSPHIKEFINSLI